MLKVCLKIAVLIFVTALTACATPKFTQSALLDNYQIPETKLPAIRLMLSYHDKPAQRICIDNNYGGSNCFNSSDDTRAVIQNQVVESNAFEKVLTHRDIVLANVASQKHWRLHLKYQETVLDSKQERLGKMLLQTLSAYFIPLNRNVKYTMDVKVVDDNNQLIYESSFVREIDEPTSWYNANTYKTAAIDSMIKELVMQLHSRSNLSLNS